MRVDVLKNSNGFTLLEVLVALGILAVLIGSASGGLATQIGHNRDAKIFGEAAYAAQTVIDELRLDDVEDMRSSGSDDPRTVTIEDRGGYGAARSTRNYEVVVDYCSNASFCSSTNPNSTVRHLAVSVLHNGEQVYNTETVFTDFGAVNSEEDTSSGSGGGGGASEEGGGSGSGGGDDDDDGGDDDDDDSGGGIDDGGGSGSGGSGGRRRRCRRWRC